MLYGERLPDRNPQATQLVCMRELQGVLNYVLLLCRSVKEIRAGSRRKIDSRVSKMYSLAECEYFVHARFRKLQIHARLLILQHLKSLFMLGISLPQYKKIL